jgi:hypothetical protein
MSYSFLHIHFKNGNTRACRASPCFNDIRQLVIQPLRDVGSWQNVTLESAFASK